MMETTTAEAHIINSYPNVDKDIIQDIQKHLADIEATMKNIILYMKDMQL